MDKGIAQIVPVFIHKFTFVHKSMEKADNLKKITKIQTAIGLAQSVIHQQLVKNIGFRLAVCTTIHMWIDASKA